MGGFAEGKEALTECRCAFPTADAPEKGYPSATFRRDHKFGRNALIALEDASQTGASRTVFDRMSKDEHHRDVRASERVLEIHL